MIDNNLDFVMPKGDDDEVAIPFAEELPQGARIDFAVFRDADLEDDMIHKTAAALNENGNAVFKLHHKDTEDLKRGTYEYRVKVTSYSGEIKTVVYGHTFTLV